jgi:hypothetical protein
MRTTIRVLLLMLLALPATRAGAVVLDDENRLSVVLADGTSVTLIGATGDKPGQKTANYYYLPSPAMLRLAKKPDGTPEFLLMKFTTEARADKGGMSGGLVHFLMEWSLTPAQETELKAKLASAHQGAQLMGAVPLEPEGESGSFQIVSATLGDKTLTPTVITSGKAPLLPGDRAAAAARLSAEGAQLLAATLEKSRSIADISIALNYRYTVMAPAVRGHITVHWDKLEAEGDSLRAKYSKQGGSCFLFWCNADATYTYSEARRQFSVLVENKIIDIHYEEGLADERTAKIRDAFFQYAMNLMSEPPKPDTPPVPPSEEEKEKSPDIKHGRQYTFSKSSMKRTFARKEDTFDLEARLAVKWQYQLVANLASWYDGVRDNPRCVASVNLNDPFFQHRDIHFILDLEAKEMFDEAVNYVTVNVRKRRSSGNPFEDHVTLDAKYVKDNGIDATVTYARGEDRDPDSYEYQAQWSLKGGLVYPPSPSWQKGSWEGVTLAPPVRPRTLEVEGDLAAMTASGVTRVTVQVHYPRFGKEVEENIQISPAANEPLVKRRVFMDRNARGYAYRLIVNHKTEGRLALPWSAQVGDDYIYAAIPANLLTEPQVHDAAKEAARSLDTSGTEQVLDKLRDLAGEKK